MCGDVGIEVQHCRTFGMKSLEDLIFGVFVDSWFFFFSSPSKLYLQYCPMEVIPFDDWLWSFFLWSSDPLVFDLPPGIQYNRLLWLSWKPAVTTLVGKNGRPNGLSSHPLSTNHVDALVCAAVGRLCVFVEWSLCFKICARWLDCSSKQSLDYLITNIDLHSEAHSIRSFTFWCLLLMSQRNFGSWVFVLQLKG